MSCRPFIAESDATWWGRIADERIQSGDHIPVRWDIGYEDGADGCLPAGWYAQGRDARDLPIVWPIRHEYGPFPTEAEAKAYAESVDTSYYKPND